MTSWRYETSWFLLVFLSMIDLSKEGGLDCIEQDDPWKQNLKNVQLFTTMDSKDTLKCTLHKMCLDNISCPCQILEEWVKRENSTTIKNEKCVEKNENITIHHFNCLLASAVGGNVTGCEYDIVCPLYRETLSKGPTTLATTSATVSTTSRKLAAASTPLSTTLTTVSPPLAPTSTTVSTSRTLATTSTPLASTLTTVSTTSRTSATTSTTVSPSTPLAKTLPEETTATTTHVTQSIQSISPASQNYQEKANPETWNLHPLLITSAICNVVFPLLVYLYMRQQRRRDWSLQNALHGDLQVNQPAAELEFLTNGTGSPDIPMKNSSLEEGTL